MSHLQRTEPTMTVMIHATGSLRTRLPTGTSLELGHGSTVGQALARLNLPSSEGLAILVNGRLAHWDTPLSAGDVVRLVPQLAGGRPGRRGTTETKRTPEKRLQKPRIDTDQHGHL